MPIRFPRSLIWASLFGTVTAASAEPSAPSASRRPPPEEQLPRLRPVLRGALFRSGTPSEDALTYLCESGYKRVYSLYGEFTTQFGPRNSNMLRHGRDQRSCSVGETQRQIEWRPAPSSRMRTLPGIFRDIIESVRDPRRGPVLVHCWNGLHYAGMVSALALRQFCGFTAEQAEAYWRANANRGASYPLIIANLHNFKPIPELSLTPEEQVAICPNLTKGYLFTQEAFVSPQQPLGQPATASPLARNNPSPATERSPSEDTASGSASPMLLFPTTPAYVPPTRSSLGLGGKTGAAAPQQSSLPRPPNNG